MIIRLSIMDKFSNRVDSNRSDIRIIVNTLDDENVEEPLIPERSEQHLPFASRILTNLSTFIRIVMQIIYVLAGISIFAFDYGYKCNYKLEFIPLLIVWNCFMQTYILTYEDIINNTEDDNTLCYRINSCFRVLTKAMFFIFLAYLIFYYPAQNECKGLSVSRTFLLVYFIIEYVFLFAIVLVLSGLILSGTAMCCPRIAIAAFQMVPFRTGASDTSLEEFPYYKFDMNGNNYTLINKLNSSDVISISTDSITCSICLDNYRHNCSVRYLQCNHHYHKHCCDEWLKINRSCPVCRASVEI